MSLEVVFYRTESGKEPVREWLKALNKQDKQAIGGDIKTIQYGWPLGMPVVRKMEPGFGKSDVVSTSVSPESCLR